jgi:signal transduction histidine kinase
MQAKWNRPAVAAVLVAAAVIVPATAWYWMGSRAAERESRALVSLAELRVREAAFRQAERLHGRFETILENENRRPFYEYLHRFRESTHSCECAPWIESPLARGPIESILAAHFEIDRRHRLTMPSVPPEDPPAAEPEGSDAAGETAASPEALASACHELPEDARARRELLDRLRRGAGAIVAAVAAERSPAGQSPDAVPASLRLPEPVAARSVSYGEQVATVGSLRWHTIVIDGRPSLVALRIVRASEGSRIQGFLVDDAAIRSVLETEPMPADFRPSRDEPNVIGESLGLEGADWEVAIDAQEILAEARREGQRTRGRFRRTFFGGTGGALLAAIFVVGLVGQSERLVRQRSRFAAAAAHELRTPLAGLRLHGDMLAEDLGDPESRRTYARRIASEADRLGRVVSNVLGYTHLERGAFGVDPVPGDLAEAIRSDVERLRPGLETNGASLEIRIPDGPLPALFDSDALFQILQNLLDNAERYGRGMADRALTVTLSSEDDAALLSIRDRGRGISRRERRRLFRPFRRGRSADSPTGLGLGLTIVRALAEAQGGSVEYAPATGGGSLFTVRLRRA